MTRHRKFLPLMLGILAAHACTDDALGPDPFTDELPPHALSKLGVPLESVEQPGPEAVGYRYEDVKLPGGRPLRLHYWYPASAAGGSEAVYRTRLYGVPIVPGRIDAVSFETVSDVARFHAPVAGGTYAAVLISPGWGNMGFDQAQYAEHLASHGFVVVSMDHNGSSNEDSMTDQINALAGATVLPCLDGGPSPCTDNVMTGFLGRVRDMTYALDVLEGQANGSGAFLRGHVRADAVGMLGHSSGAGLAVVAAAGQRWAGLPPEPRVRAIMPLGFPGGLDPSDFGAVEIPSLFSVGTDDRTTPPLIAQSAFYAMGSDPRMMVQLAGAVHRSFNSNWCKLLQAVGSVVLQRGDAAMGESILLATVLTHPSSGTAFQYCSYEDFVQPVDLTGLIESITGIAVVPGSVPTGLSLEDATRITRGQAMAFFTWALEGKPQYERFLLPNNVLPPVKLTRCFETEAGTLCWDGSGEGYEYR